METQITNLKWNYSVGEMGRNVLLLKASSQMGEGAGFTAPDL